MKQTICKGTLSFALCSLLIGLLSLPTLVASWDFSWFGNPDQDLVFLRDGWRLYQQKSPLYSEHPGAIQSLVVAFAAWMQRLFGIFTAELYSAPSEEELQGIFQLAKLVNYLIYVLLIAVIVERISSFTGAFSALIIGCIVAISSGLSVEIVQLRNEAYSSLFFILATSQILTYHSRELRQERAALNPSRFWTHIAIYIVLSGLSVMAKVQIVPLFFFLSLGISLLGKVSYGMNRINLFTRSILSSFATSALVLLATKTVDLHLGKQGFVVGIFTIMVLLFPIFWTNQLRPTSLKNDISCALFSAAAISLFLYVFYLITPGWVSTFLDISKSSVHAVSSSSCSSLSCSLQLASDSIYYLFKRMFWSNMFSSFMGALIMCYFACLAFMQIKRSRGFTIVLVCIISFTSFSIFSLEYGLTGKFITILGCMLGAALANFVGINNENLLTQKTSLFVFFCSIFIAVFCGLRWPADHYLMFQQPFLVFGLLTEPSLKSFKTLRFALCTSMFASLLYIQGINLRLLSYTYQKSLDLSSPDLCATQHQGSSWDRTFISELNCNFN